jgi:putative transcription antitermination factor YqgF
VRKFLAIDYGTKRVGVAVAFASLAEPVEVVPNDPGLFDRLLALIQEHSATNIVVGISEREMAENTKKFVADFQAFLREHISQQPLFHFHDETLSSVEVYAKLHQAGKRDIRQNGPIDHYAAAQILQDFLDLHQDQEKQ